MVSSAISNPYRDPDHMDGDPYSVTGAVLLVSSSYVQLAQWRWFQILIYLRRTV